MHNLPSMITCELQLATNAPRRNRRFVYNHFYASSASLSCNWTIIPIQNHGHRMSKRDLDDHERHSSHQRGIPRSLPLVRYVRTRRNLTWRFNSTNFPWAQQIMRYACQLLIFLKYKPSSHLACLISLRKKSTSASHQAFCIECETRKLDLILWFDKKSPSLSIIVVVSIVVV